MWPRRLPERYELVAVCFLAAAACYLDRVGFPLAYTVMAQARDPRRRCRTRGRVAPVRALVQCTGISPRSPSPQAAGVTKEAQGRVHSAFYYGYTLSQARQCGAAQNPGGVTQPH